MPKQLTDTVAVLDDRAEAAQLHGLAGESGGAEDDVIDLGEGRVLEDLGRESLLARYMPQTVQVTVKALP